MPKPSTGSLLRLEAAALRVLRIPLLVSVDDSLEDGGQGRDLLGGCRGSRLSVQFRAAGSAAEGGSRRHVAGVSARLRKWPNSTFGRLRSRRVPAVWLRSSRVGWDWHQIW